LKDLHYGQFYSFKDNDGRIYGFDIASIYNLIYKNTDTINISKIGGINPYNRNKIPTFVMIDLKMIIRTSKILKIKINLEFDTDIGNVSNAKTVEMRALSLFQNIDSLGNYSSPEWFLTLNRNQLIKFLRELSDIWNYNNVEEPFSEKAENHLQIRRATVILINEGQFFLDLYECVIDMLKEKKQVYICGLDGDFERKRFGSILELIPICDNVTKLKALCSLCKNGTPGIFSLRLSNEKQQMLIGSDNYIPVCRNCYDENS
jgi:hypothetical protein